MRILSHRLIRFDYSALKFKQNLNIFICQKKENDRLHIQCAHLSPLKFSIRVIKADKKFSLLGWI